MKLSHSMLTTETLTRFENLVNVEALDAETAAKVEHFAYCANMGAENKAAAWAWFSHLCAERLGIDLAALEAEDGKGPDFVAVEHETHCTLIEKGGKEEVTFYKTLEGALDWIAGSAANRAGKSAAEFEAAAVAVAPGVYEIKVNGLQREA